MGDKMTKQKLFEIIDDLYIHNMRFKTIANNHNVDLSIVAAIETSYDEITIDEILDRLPRITPNLTYNQIRSKMLTE